MTDSTMRRPEGGAVPTVRRFPSPAPRPGDEDAPSSELQLRRNRDHLRELAPVASPAAPEAPPAPVDVTALWVLVAVGTAAWGVAGWLLVGAVL